MDANSVVVAREVSVYWLEPEIIGALITGLSILGVAFIGSLFGLRKYFRKREYELILKRYLDEGIDRISEIVDGALRVFVNNHTIASTIVLQAKHNEEANLPDKFDRFERRYLTLTPFEKIKYLVGDAIFIKAVHAVLGFVEASTVVFDTDFRSKLAVMPTEPIRREKLLDGIDKFLEEYFRKSEKYSQVLRELQYIASILEKETALNWAKLGKFKNRPDVKQSVERLKNLCTEFNKQIKQPT